MKKGMLFGLSRREKRVKKINLLHFPVFTSKNIVILKMPEPSTDLCTFLISFEFSYNTWIKTFNDEGLTLH